MTSTSLRLLILIILIVIHISGCITRNISSDPVTITFAFPESPDRKKYQVLVDEFQKDHPNINIDLKSNPAGNIIRNADNGIDAFIWWPDPSLSSGDTPIIQPVETLLKQTRGLSEDDFYPRSVEMFRWDEKLWALPAEIDMQLLYYNRDYFDEQGVAYPQTGWTWEDLLSTAKLMTTVPGQERPINGYYGLVSNPRWGDFVPFIYQHGSDIFAWDDPRLAESVQWYADLSQVHGVMPQIKYVYDADTYGFFREQKAAMWIGFLADRAGLGFHHLAGLWQFGWGIVPLPSGAHAEGTLYRGQGYYISSHCERVAAAWTWIQFLSSHPLEKALPARQVTAESDDFQALVGEQVAGAALHAVEHLVPRISTQGYPPEMLEIYARTVESVVNDGIRVGFYTQPAYAREFAIIVEAVMAGEMDAIQAIDKLEGELED